MVVGSIIEQVLLRVTGGKPVTDSRVKREDIKNYLAPSVNYALLQDYYVSKREDGISDFPEDFVATFEDVPVLTNTARELRYINLPGQILSMTNNRGIRQVSPMKGDSEFVQINANDRKHNSYYANSFADITTYFLEGQKIYFLNLPLITNKVLVRMIQSVNDLEDDVELPVPAGMEVQVINLMVEFFTGQRAIPADLKPDNSMEPTK